MSSLERGICIFSTPCPRIFKSLEICMNLNFRSSLYTIQILSIQTRSFEIEAVISRKPYFFSISYTSATLSNVFVIVNLYGLNKLRMCSNYTFIFDTTNFYFGYVIKKYATQKGVYRGDKNITY